MKNFCFVGHACLDVISEKINQEGGACVYGAVLAKLLTDKVSVITSVGKDFPIKKYFGIDWVVQESKITTKYKHHYDNQRRISSLSARGNAIDISKIPSEYKKSDVVMICPIVQEVTPEAIDFFDTPWIALTPQGWFRKFDGHGEVSWTRSVFRELPRKIKLIVVSRDDISEDSNAWAWIKESAEISVCTMGKEGYILSNNGSEKKYEPLEIIQEKNPTGCGDIFSTSFLYLLRGGLSAEDAAKYAGHAAGLASTQDGINESAKIAADYLETINKI